MVSLREKIGRQTVSVTYPVYLRVSIIVGFQSYQTMRKCCEAGYRYTPISGYPLTTHSWYVRAPTVAEVKELDPRVRACFQ
jgi:hypothetical protein